MIGCKNCGHRFEGKYCNLCGQKGDTHRINFHYVLHEVPHALFHFEYGIFYTIRELLLRPGKTIKGFLDGQRVRLFKPVLFLLVTTSVTALFVALKNKVFHLPAADPSHLAKQKPLAELTHFIQSHPGLSLLILVPFISLINQWFFRKQKYNYWENMVINTYVIGNLNLIYIVGKFLEVLIFRTNERNIIRVAMELCFFGYMVWVYFQVYRGGEALWKTWVKCLLAPVAAFIMIVILLVLFGAAGLFLFK
ncbi:MAG: DUF3667 domain-containing protein [Sphingobacteriaceae bacterium]|nr:MAG: DUF3667 domain-containing protein [Sphingobacteriaceae bacterium]